MNEDDPQMLAMNRQEIKHEIESVTELQSRLIGASEDFFKADMIDKTLRYGNETYTKKFLMNQSGNVCAHMRVYAHTKDLTTLIEKQLVELKAEKIRLDRLLGPEND